MVDGGVQTQLKGGDDRFAHLCRLDGQHNAGAGRSDSVGKVARSSGPAYFPLLYVASFARASATHWFAVCETWAVAVSELNEARQERMSMKRRTCERAIVTIPRAIGTANICKPGSVK